MSKLILAETLQLLHRKNTGTLQAVIAANAEFQIFNENRISTVLRLFPFFGNFRCIAFLLLPLKREEQ